MSYIPVYEPYLAGNEKEYVNQCLDSTWISSKGAFIQQFEKKFSDYLAAPFATTVANGTVALHLALEALGIGPGDEVILPTLTYVASVNTIMQTGAKPVFVDSLASSWQMDPLAVQAKISEKTKAIMAVHLYGLPCEMHALQAICKQHQLWLLEDCAEAFGTRYHNQYAGTFGDMATFSFFGNKTITTGEGGMVVANKQDLWAKACLLKNQGVSPDREYWHTVAAYNYRMTNICAAIGLAQMEQADVILSKKRDIAHWYQEGLTGLPLQMHAEMPDTQHSYWMCSLLVGQKEERPLLREHLKTTGIETRPVFYPAHTLPHCKTEEDFPVAMDLSQRGLNLPSSPKLSIEQVASICDTIREFYGN